MEGKSAPAAAREGGKANGPAGMSVFVAESDERLQDAMRDNFKEMGFRVLIAADPERALDRFRQQPFDALIVDARTTGEDGRLVFEHVMDEAGRKQFGCAGILILGKKQADWAKRIPERPKTALLIDPGVTMKMLKRKLLELLSEEDESHDGENGQR